MSFRTRAVAGAGIVAVAAAYFGAAQVGLRLALVGEQVTPIWPPTGIALACLLVFGVRTWPGIALGAFVTNVALGPSLLAVVAITLGNTAAPVCAYLLLRRAGFRNRFDRLGDALALVFLGALGGMLISATAGSLALAVFADGSRNFWGTWSVWWTGDAMGVLTFTPLLLMADSVRVPKALNPFRVAEGTVVLVGTAAVAVVGAYSSAPLLFLVFPFLIWSALRFQLAGAMPCALIASIVATVAASRDLPVYAGLDLTAKMIHLQLFNASVTLTALLHATVIVQRDRARAAVDDACAQLAQAVTLLGRGSTLGDGIADVVDRFQSGNPAGTRENSP
ncbi:integral membrane sensor domain MASE1 [Nocardia transvalensis]|uniref:Integral membrane sensor domain MASE1 n=1 Tax=Nocardia transvalensis TaxID=37333 RepID=A0A7W9UM31_9NOCA|nr:MASE1 domain-containing protein [Nocardia transvalensis]MBB5918211.1 integral membrane sensor domain MASE1 [Nocardia transvalensis]